MRPKFTATFHGPRHVALDEWAQYCIAHYQNSRDTYSEERQEKLIKDGFIASYAAANTQWMLFSTHWSKLQCL
jgi:hypothetical protein